MTPSLNVLRAGASRSTQCDTCVYHQRVVSLWCLEPSGGAFKRNGTRIPALVPVGCPFWKPKPKPRRTGFALLLVAALFFFGQLVRWLFT